jgi:LysR family transcriptional regulator, hydrogen peroxide-inducible genes activator
MNLTLKQCRYFEALVRHGHFGRAAEASAISQPALSMQIKEMETALGVDLFERDARHVRLTGFGEEVVLRIREILNSVDELGNLARASRGKLAGRLRLGVIPTIAPYLLPTVLNNLAREYDGLDIQVRETMTWRLIQELEEGRLDVAVVALPISLPWLTEIALFTENFVLLRPEADDGKPMPNAEALGEMRLLLLEDGHCFRDQALSFCKMSTRSTPWKSLDASSLATLVQMVGAGLGVTLLPEMAVPIETRSASVSISHFSNPQPSRKIGMIWRKTSPLAKQFAQMSKIVRHSAEQMQDKPDRIRSRKL